MTTVCAVGNICRMSPHQFKFLTNEEFACLSREEKIEYVTLAIEARDAINSFIAKNPLNERLRRKTQRNTKRS